MFAFSRRTHDEDEDNDNDAHREEKKPQAQPRKRKPQPPPPEGAVDKPEKPPMLVRDANTKQLKVNPALLGSPPPPHRVPGPSCVKCCVTRYRCGVAETRNIEVPKDYLSGTMTMLLLGLCFCSIGLLVSSLTESQIIAALLTFAPLVADTSLSGLRVVRELDAIIRWRGRPALGRRCASSRIRSPQSV